MFIESVQKELARNTLQRTENGALGHVSSGKNLLDMNFRISSYRNKTDREIFSDFVAAFNEDEIMAMRFLFYARDVRGGLGERRLFRVVLTEMAKTRPDMIVKLLALIPEFGRWDDLFVLKGTQVEPMMYLTIAKQLDKDLANSKVNEPISLLAKWMPSINCSNNERRAFAAKVADTFGMKPRTYRKMLSALRKYLNVVEQKISAKEWQEIDYSAVPSRANLIYNSTFLKNDEVRRRGFLQKVEKGEEKINGGTNFPHDIVHKYSGSNGYWSRSNSIAVDAGLEALWKALPNYAENMTNTLVVADGSGSMFSTVGDSEITSLDVANSLAIYFAERCEGGFKNHYITFSGRPQLVNLGTGTLRSKIDIALKHSEVANTNVEAVFTLILNTAIRGKMKQEELPATILVISDMEFDGAVTGSRVNKTLFETIAMRFAESGYAMPKLAFWNVCSRTMTIPVIENDAGVTLVSGFSPAAIKMVLGNEADPYKALVKVLMNPKYDVVEEALTK